MVVSDVAFPGKLPMIKDALTIEITAERPVSWKWHTSWATRHGASTSACPLRELAKDMEVTAAGSHQGAGRYRHTGQNVPVGEAMDDAGEVRPKKSGEIRPAPILAIRVRQPETGAQSRNLLAPYAKGGKVGAARRCRRW